MYPRRGERVFTNGGFTMTVEDQEKAPDYMLHLLHTGRRKPCLNGYAFEKKQQPMLGLAYSVFRSGPGLHLISLNNDEKEEGDKQIPPFQ
jgi:hypothetical protein